MSSKRKYSATIETSDVWEALDKLGAEAHARLELQVTTSVVSPMVVIVRVLYHDPLTVADLGPVYVFQETLARVRRVELASYLHRVLWDSWTGYHSSPWQWTRGMRKASTAS